MKVLTKIKDVVNQQCFYEIVSTVYKFKNIIRRQETSLDNYAVAILASENYDPPLVTCINIIIPKSLNEAKHMYEEWVSLEKNMLHVTKKNCSAEEIRSEFITIILDEIRDKGPTETIMYRLSIFWVYFLTRLEVSLKEQVRINNSNSIEGYFSLITSQAKVLYTNAQIDIRVNEEK